MQKPSAEKPQNTENREDFVYGIRSVEELFQSDRQVECVYIATGEKNKKILRLVSIAKEMGLPVKEVNGGKLNSLSGFSNHQGIVATCSVAQYAEVEDIILLARQKQEPLFVIVLNEIEDPHNLGAIIRTAEASGAHGIIIGKRRQVGLNATVFKTSAGATAHLKVARVANINSALETLKKAGAWVYGADMDGQDAFQVDFNGDVALVIGSEGKGLGKLVKKNCDVIVRLPMVGKINSLNASVAGGILMYQVLKSRLK